jgi:hypothetical protein
MKYGELIEFERVDEVKELRKADDAEQARNDVRTYVISDAMAGRLRDVVFPSLGFAQSGGSKCFFVVATYGTGKTHLMSVITAIAERAELLDDLTNRSVAAAARPIAGLFRVIRSEIGATRMPLRDIVCGQFEEGLGKLGVTFKFPSANDVSNTKDSLGEMMAAFEAKYPDQGLLFALDELLDYLRQRRDTELIYDLSFLREIGEFAGSSRFRLIAGIQESLFDNPRFESAADIIRRVRDRYQQVSIVREDVAFVVKERLLRKTVAQRDLITEHLQRFSPGFKGMAEHFDDYVSLFPIHPSYLETFEQIQIVEKRRILSSLSAAMTKVMNEEVPTDAAGLICYDAYREQLADDKTNRTIEAVRDVLGKSATLRLKVERSLSPADDIPMALRIIDALAVHRLTTGGDIFAKIGPTPADLRDDLLLQPPNAPLDPLFLEESVQNVIEEIGRAVSWQFIQQDHESRQVYLDVTKDIDYDEKIRERADSLDENELDRAYFLALEQVLEQRDQPYQANINIWEYQVRWAERRVTRRGYLFFGAPNERSTAKPPRDFYLYFLQPFDPPAFTDEEKPDEVFFRLEHPDKEFRSALRQYAGAVAKEYESAAPTHQRVYREKHKTALTTMTTWLRAHMNEAITVTRGGETLPLGERFARLAAPRGTIKSVVDAIASDALRPHFESRYPGYPTFQAEITYGADANAAEMVRQTIAGIVSGKPSQTATRVLSSLELIDAKGAPILTGTYAARLLDDLAKTGGRALNRSDLLTELDRDVRTWGPWHLEPAWLTVVAAALCQQGKLELGFTLGQLDATSLGRLTSMSLEELEAISHVAPPKETPITILKAAVELVGMRASDIPVAGINDQLVKTVLGRVAEMRERVTAAIATVKAGIKVWGQDVIGEQEERLGRLAALSTVVENLRTRDSVGRLNKIDLTADQIAAAEKGKVELEWVERTQRGANRLADDASYLRSARDVMGEADPLKEDAELFRKALLDAFLDGEIEDEEVASLLRDAGHLRGRYADAAARAHGRDRLDTAGDDRKREINNGASYKALGVLGKITLLPEDKLRSIREKLAGLIGCREFDERELRKSVICSRCEYRPRPSDVPTARARLDVIGEEVVRTYGEWERTLVDGITDPETQRKIPALSPGRQEIIERFTKTRALPPDVDAAFVDAVNAALARFEPRKATASDVWAALYPTATAATMRELRDRFDDYLAKLAGGAAEDRVRVIPSADTEE